jgi:outer membrane protein assembly factor BamB
MTMNVLRKLGRRSQSWTAPLATVLLAAMLYVLPLTTADAAELAANPLVTGSLAPGAITVHDGTVTGGSHQSLRNNDQNYYVIQAGAAGAGYEVDYSISATLGAEKSRLRSLFIPIDGKSSLAGVSLETLLWNFGTSNWDVVASSTTGITDSELLYSSNVPTAFAPYVSPSSEVRVRHTLTSASSFTASSDYMNILYEYGDAANLLAASYDADTVRLAEGTVSANDASKLADRDGIAYSVSSAANKADWQTQFTLEQAANQIRTLVVEYDGNYSAEANTQWLSLWNYETGNWEVVYDTPARPEGSAARWAVSDAVAIGRYVSANNDIRVRLYNSGSGAFVRHSDYLNVTVYYEPTLGYKTFSPDAATVEFGTATGGNAASLAQRDLNKLVIASDSSKRIAWISEAGLTGVDKRKVTSLTVSMTMNSSTSATNPMYLSLWNFDTGSWQVQKTMKTRTEEETIRFTITDPLHLESYISDASGVRARVYNSAVSATPAYTRATDLLHFAVEYGEVTAFEFAMISDVHELVGHNNFLSVIDDLNTVVQPAFIVNTGDVTDHGVPAEFDQYAIDRALIEFPLYEVPGNHDVRWWNSNGKKDYEQKVGPLYQSFDYGGVHFVLLDSTVTLENDGKLSPKLLNWVASDLANVSQDTPIIFFAHHPFEILRNVTAKQELLDRFRNYNIVAYLSGHMHRWDESVENGVPWVFIGQLKEYQEYIRVKITPNKFYITRRDAATGNETAYLQGDMRNKRKPSWEITTASALSNGNVNVAVQMNDLPDGIVSVQANIDNYGGWTTLNRLGSTQTWTGTIDISAYSPEIPYGKHFVAVRMTDLNGEVWKTYKEYEWGGGAVATKWTYKTGGMIQAPPTYHEGRVYAGAEDGKVYAINDSDGSLAWSYQTGGDILSSPAVYERAAPQSDLILIGSHDKKLYALNADTGVPEWTYTTGGSVISNPLVEGGVVYFGSGDLYIYALDADDGTLMWRYLTEGLLRQTPILVGGKLYANVRDKHVWYALNASDGSLYWRGNANTDDSLFVIADVEPLYAGGQLWVINPMPGKISRLNPATGAVSWSDSTGKSFSSRGGATDGTNVFYATHHGRIIYAFDAATGTVDWIKDLRAGATDSDLQQYSVNSGLVYADGILFQVAERGRVIGMDPANGNILFKYDAVGYPERVLWSTPSVANGTVYMGGIDGVVYAIRYNGI